MYKKETLANGLRILTGEMPHTRSVSIGIFVGAGSRYERDPEAGVSHFIEHLLFKGTEKRATAKDISEAIEGVGGILNAGTSEESTVYSCKVASPYFTLALDVLIDMLLHSRFEFEEIEKERKVIIEELHMSRDDPRDWVNVIIDEVLWPNHPLGRDIGGTVESVGALTREMALEYMFSHYSPRNTVVAVAGDITHQQVVDEVARAFGDWSHQPSGPWFPAGDSQGSPRLRIAHKKTEQAHLCLGVPGLSYVHPDRFILDLLNVILGEGMSSRLFQEIREKRGLAYDVHSYLAHFQDTGAAIVYAGVDINRIEVTIEAILAEWQRLKEGIPPMELARCKEFTKGRLLLRMEDSRSVVGWMGGQELLTSQILTVDEVVEIIDAITSDDIQRMARELFVPERLNLAVVGPYEDESRFASLLKM